MESTLQHQADRFLTQTALSSAPRFQSCISSPSLKPNCGRAPSIQSSLEVSEKLTNGFLLKSKAGGIILGCLTRLKCHVLMTECTGMTKGKKEMKATLSNNWHLKMWKAALLPLPPLLTSLHLRFWYNADKSEKQTGYESRGTTFTLIPSCPLNNPKHINAKKTNTLEFQLHILWNTIIPYMHDIRICSYGYGKKMQ